MEWSDVPSCYKDVWMLIERCEKDAVKKLKRCVEDVLKIIVKYMEFAMDRRMCDHLDNIVYWVLYNNMLIFNNDAIISHYFKIMDLFSCDLYW